MILWLAMSGIYDNGLILGLGVFSCALCVWITARLGLLGSGLGADLEFAGAVKYIGWLMVEIGRADWAVTKLILAPELPKRQRLIHVPCEQTSDIGRALFANSITITPGTVTVETEADYFIVHALSDEAADMAALTAMGAQVSRIERGAARAGR
ncbi:Na+/H+ antiporter subunit E [Rhizobiaceae bacterium]|nr:Na+/H+ antiporter subunit E [Rhizobiaceae bacterium]